MLPPLKYIGAASHHREGHWGTLKTTKPHKNLPKIEKPQLILIKTENCIKNIKPENLPIPVFYTMKPNLPFKTVQLRMLSTAVQK